MIKKIHVSIAALALFGLLGAACGSKTTPTTTPPTSSTPAASTPAASTPAGTTVTAKDFLFSLKDVTVKVGDAVTWNFLGAPHTVTAVDGSFESGTKNAGGTYAFTFTKAGTFKYYCKFHGAKDGTGMAGSVTVQ